MVEREGEMYCEERKRDVLYPLLLLSLSLSLFSDE